MKLNVGCGTHKLPGFMNIDANAKVKPDHLSDCRKLEKNFGKDSVEEVRSYHMLEHLCEKDGLIFLEQCFRVLKMGGRLYLELPDLTGVLEEYLASTVRGPCIMKQRIFGMQRNQFDYHLWGYRFFELHCILRNIGFTAIRRIAQPDNEFHAGPLLVVEARK